MDIQNAATAVASEPNQVPANTDGTPSTPVTAPPPVNPTPKVEVKDGKYFIDGKAFVSEADLIGAKKSLEGKLELAQTAHNQAIDQAKLELSESNKTIASLNVKLQEASKSVQTGAQSAEDIAKAKELEETLKKSIEAESSRALEYRKQLMTVQYNVPADTLKDKTMAQLDSLEEALKVVSANRGNNPGNYATGGGGGSVTTMTPEERARQVIANTPYRGVSNAAIK